MGDKSRRDRFQGKNAEPVRLKKALGILTEEIAESPFLILIEIEIRPPAEETILDEQMGDSGVPKALKYTLRSARPLERSEQEIFAIHIGPVHVIPPVSRKEETDPGLLREVLVDVSHRSILRDEPRDILVAADFSAKIAERVHLGELTPEIAEVQSHEKNETRPKKNAPPPSGLGPDATNPPDHVSQTEN
jgi:hypothetical protein